MPGWQLGQPARTAAGMASDAVAIRALGTACAGRVTTAPASAAAARKALQAWGGKTPSLETSIVCSKGVSTVPSSVTVKARLSIVAVRLHLPWQRDHPFFMASREVTKMHVCLVPCLHEGS